MGVTRSQKVYTLTNGDKITPGQLAKQLRMSVPSGRCRLEKYSDPESVYRKVGENRPKREYTCKVYTLSDGSSKTAREVSEKYDVPLCNIRNRLSNGITQIKRLKKKPNENKQHRLGVIKSSTTIPLNTKHDVSKVVSSRNFFCPLSRLLLRVI